jgi:hypothetical protein
MKIIDMGAISSPALSRCRLPSLTLRSAIPLLQAEAQKLRVEAAALRREHDSSSAQAQAALEKRFRELTELLVSPICTVWCLSRKCLRFLGCVVRPQLVVLVKLVRICSLPLLTYHGHCDLVHVGSHAVLWWLIVSSSRGYSYSVRSMERDCDRPASAARFFCCPRSTSASNPDSCQISYTLYA